MANTGNRGKASTNDDLGLDDFTQPQDEHGLSLEDLSEAYAQLLDGGAEPYDGDPQDEADGETFGEGDKLKPEDACEVTPRSILEAILFVGNVNSEPLSNQQMAARMRGVSPREVDELVVELNEIYEREGCPYHIISVGSGYTMQLRDEFSRLRDKFYGRVREARLSQAAVDVLALVAYRQPLTSQEVNDLRGVPSGGILSQLVRRQLLRIERPDEKPRTPKYFTTERFLGLFGLTNITELPQTRDIDKNV